MAFQPVQFAPLGNPLADGINQIVAARRQQKLDEMQRAKFLLEQQNSQAQQSRADAELQLQQQQFTRTGKNQADEEQRKGAADFQAIYEASGRDPVMARQLAKAHGYDIVDGPNGPVAVQSTGKQTPDPQAAQPPVPSPVSSAAPPPVSPPAPEPGGPGAGAAPAAPGGQQFAPWAGLRINQPGASPTQPPPAGGEQPAPQASGPGPASDNGIMPYPGEAPAPPPAAANAIMRAFMISKGGGPQLSIDPAAAKKADEEKLAEAIKLKSAAPQEQIIARQNENEKKRQFLLDHPELKNQPLTFDEREKLANISGGFRVKAATAGAQNPLKVDAGTRQDMGTLEKTYNDWIRANQLAIDSKTNKRLQTADTNLSSDNAMQQREGAESLVSIFKGGGQVTKASQDLLLKHLGGLVGDAQTFVQHLENGKYGARELNVLREAAKGAIQEQNERVQTAQQSAIATFGPGSGFEALGGNVNHKLNGFFRQFGIDNPDIYPPEAAPTAVLGSGHKPKVNPIVKAAKASKLSPEDKAAVDWAKAHKGDPRASQILQMHGM